METDASAVLATVAVTPCAPDGRRVGEVELDGRRVALVEGDGEASIEISTINQVVHVDVARLAEAAVVAVSQAGASDEVAGLVTALAEFNRAADMVRAAAKALRPNNPIVEPAYLRLGMAEVIGSLAEVLIANQGQTLGSDEAKGQLARALLGAENVIREQSAWLF